MKTSKKWWITIKEWPKSSLIVKSFLILLPSKESKKFIST